MTKTYFSGNRTPITRRLMKIGAAAVLGLVLIQSNAFAQSITVRIPEMQGTIEVKALGTLESRGGEEKIEFLKRVGRTMESYTTATKQEACGIIIERTGRQGMAEGRWVVPMVTQMSQIACATVMTIPYDGTPTGESIHTHPSFERNQYIANQMDVKFFHGLHGKRIQRGKRMTLNRAGGAAFSSTDFASGPGWVVDGGQLLFQNGPQNVVNHGTIHISQDMAMADTLPIPALPGIARGNIQMVELPAIPSQPNSANNLVASNQTLKP